MTSGLGSGYIPSAEVGGHGQLQPPTISSRIDSEIGRLEDRLEKLKQARNLLQQTPELKELLDLVSQLNV